MAKITITKGRSENMKKENEEETEKDEYTDEEYTLMKNAVDNLHNLKEWLI